MNPEKTPETHATKGEADYLVGTTISDRYEILSLIARGGMGKVYKAQQKALARVVALKVLSPEPGASAEGQFHRRFHLEAATISKLTHPNTVTIYDFGHCDKTDVYFIAMEYLEGRTLTRVLREEGALAENRANLIAQQICRSVEEAHGIGVVHRDLKPGNVMLVTRGDEVDFAKVLDFGLVKDVTSGSEELTRGGVFMGSPKYMSPEQVQAQAITPATDVYALGLLLYEMLCGKGPFNEKGGKLMAAHVNVPPIPLRVRSPGLTISAEMEAIVMRCIEKAPEKRYPSMREVRLALRVLSDEHLDDSQSLPRIGAAASRYLRPRSTTFSDGKGAVIAPAPSDTTTTGPVASTCGTAAQPVLEDLEADMRRLRPRWHKVAAGGIVLAVAGAVIALSVLDRADSPASSAATAVDAGATSASSNLPEPPPPREARPPTVKVEIQPLTQGKGITSAVFVSGTEPVFSRDALSAKAQGTLVAKCVIRATGTVGDCRMLRGVPLLNVPIMKALETRKYTPGKNRGVPVDAEYVFTIDVNYP